MHIFLLFLCLNMCVCVCISGSCYKLVCPIDLYGGSFKRNVILTILYEVFYKYCGYVFWDSHFP